jgi:signal transduction histidine kinase
MNKKLAILLLSLFLCGGMTSAQDNGKSELQQRAEAEDAQKNVAKARFLYIRAFEDYTEKGQLKQGVECATKATALYYKDSFWKEAFELLRRADQTINAEAGKAGQNPAALHYIVTKERLQMYMKLRKVESAKDQLAVLEGEVNQSGDEKLRDDLLYNKAIYYYTFGMNVQGNAVFKEMADKLTAAKDYDKVDEVYQTLIANGRKSGSANLVAQSYSSYMAWKDSVSALKMADERKALKQQIADNEAAIAEQDSSLTARMATIIALLILAAALAGALVVGGIILMRYIYRCRKQEKVIELANENNALKSKFISDISAQLEPTLQKFDKSKPEVKALLDFSSHIQTLSDLENTPADEMEMKEIQMPPFCDELVSQIRGKVKSGVSVTATAQNMNAKINKEYVTHILLHLLTNAAEYTPEGGAISLEFKKRGPRAFQFIVSDTGQGIAEEKRQDIFKPFTEIRDLTTGDGLGLPICKQMALKMDGDLEIDPQYTKGTRFVLSLHS